MRFNVTGFQLDPMPRIFWAHLILWEISFGKAVIWLDGCKKLFVFPQYQYLEASNQVGTPLRLSARTHSIFSGTIGQIGVADWTLPHLHSHFLSNGMYLSYSLMTKTLLITKLQIDFLSIKEWSIIFVHMSIISKQPWDIQLQTNGPFVKFKPGVCESIGNIHILTKLNYIYRLTILVWWRCKKMYIYESIRTLHWACNASPERSILHSSLLGYSCLLFSVSSFCRVSKFFCWV